MENLKKISFFLSLFSLYQQRLTIHRRVINFTGCNKQLLFLLKYLIKWCFIYSFLNIYWSFFIVFRFMLQRDSIKGCCHKHFIWSLYKMWIVILFRIHRSITFAKKYFYNFCCFQIFLKSMDNLKKHDFWL